MTRLYRRLSLLLALGLLAGCASAPQPPSGNGSQQTMPQYSVHADAATRRAFAQARAAMQSGQLDKAMTQLQRLAASHPDISAIHNSLGVAYRRNGDLAKAEAAYKVALATNPGNRNAHLNLGILYDAYLQQPAQARRQYQRYQELGSAPDPKVAAWIANLQKH